MQTDTDTISINNISDVLNNPENMINQNSDNDIETNPFDIFSNPQIQKAKESLPPHVRQQYEQIGENIWNQMESSQKIIDNNAEFGVTHMPPPVEEAAANISEAIKSGLHPTMLDEDEAKVMLHCFGEKWYETFGFTEQDMEEEI